MKRRQRAGMAAAMLCAVAVQCIAHRAEALVLRGHFPDHNGMYWNFEDSATQQETTWAVLGQFARSGVGSLIVLARQGEGFLALREQWDGLYLHGDYRPDGFTEPETPVMFMPYEIGFDHSITQSTRMRRYAAGEAGGLREEYEQRVTISLQAFEDINFEGREIRNCAVIVKTTEQNGVATTETCWLAPSIGPVKMRVKAPSGPVRTYELQSYRTDRAEPPQEISLDEYFPLNPGTLYEYRDRSGEPAAVKIGAREERLGRQTVPYAEPGGDVYYLSRDERGVVIPLQFAVAMGFALASLPPDKPSVLLPARSAVGRLNHSLSNVRPCQWPSLQPMLDFYPENEIDSVIVGVEDVTVPAGTYKDCIKLCLSFVGRSFSMQREKIRSEFIWFARGVGEVRREGLSLANTYMADTSNYIYQIEGRELVAVRRFELPAGAASAEVTDQHAARQRIPAEDLVWQDASKRMFDTAVESAPFFVRMIVRSSLLDAVAERADAGGRVTEDAVIDAVRATTPEKARMQLIDKLEKMKIR